MRNFLIAISILFLSEAGVLAQPVVTQISNAASASYSVPPPANNIAEGWLTLPNGSIAQGSYFSIYGNGLAADISTCGSGNANCLWHPYPLPTSIQGTSVAVTVGGAAPVEAYIAFAAQVSSTFAQINAVLPSTTPVGAGTLTVTYNGQTSAPVPINVVASSFGTFSFNQAGSGPGIITNVNYQLLTPFQTAKPGDYVLLWGTGLGAAPNPSTEQNEPPSQTNLCSSASTCPVTVWVGGKPASVTYAGRSGYTAEDQVVFIVPPALAGCYIPVAVVTGNVTSNFTTMPVDPSGAACSDTNGVGMSYINSLVSASGYASIGLIGLQSQYWNFNQGGDSFTPWIYDTVAAQIGKFSPSALELFQGFTQSPSAGTCTANAYLGYAPPPDPGLGYVTNLDAGPALTATSAVSSLASQSVPQLVDAGGALAGYFSVVGGVSPKNEGALNDQGWPNPSFFWLSTPNGDGTYTINGMASGNYMVTGVGGKDIGALNATIDVSAAAAALHWTNSDQFDDQNATPTFSRQSPLTLTWSGGDPAGFVDIVLVGSAELNDVVPLMEPGVEVQCIAPVSAGSFTVPSYVLQALPASFNNSNFAGGVAIGSITAPQKISPPPTGLDVAYIYYQILQGYSVQWQ